jgi:hypothetical protein
MCLLRFQNHAIRHLVERTQFAKKETGQDLVLVCLSTLVIHTTFASLNVLPTLIVIGQELVSIRNAEIHVLVFVDRMQNVTLSIILRAAIVCLVSLEILSLAVMSHPKVKPPPSSDFVDFN